ncbi:hypothetical protein [Faecousia sp.]|uniref:hypothetical protein n=1 Tax=Faecousia sp. TaxID=2952921 RepID=UPI003AB339C6
MKKQIVVAPELVRLHEHYIVEEQKPTREILFYSYISHLNIDEVCEFVRAVDSAPRIGQLYPAGRKRRDELIAIPRGLMDYIISEWKRAVLRVDLMKENKKDTISGPSGRNFRGRCEL